MKILATILSLFFLTLSVLPCSDEIEAEEVVLEQLADKDCESPEAEDLCSPFCHCQCCSTHITNFQLFSFEALSLEIPVATFAHFDRKEQEVLHSFLQPPRV